MNFKSYFYAATAFICFGSLSVPAHAGQLFPPANIGQHPNVSCPNGSLLTWHGDHVDCADPTPGVSVTCPAGQVLTGIASGVPSCADTSVRLSTTAEEIKANCGYPGDPNPPNYSSLQYNTTCGSRFCAAVYGSTWGMVTEYGPGYNMSSPWNSDPNTYISVVCER